MKTRAMLFLLATLAAELAAQEPGKPSARQGATDQRVAPRIQEVEQVLTRLVGAYGVSGMETPVRDAVQQLLPPGVRGETDTAGNLWVTIGSGDPIVVFIAHLDEIGFRVTHIREDGSLDLNSVGGLFPSMWEAKPALVHTGSREIPGVFLPRDSGAAVDSARTPPELRAEVGTRSRAASMELGIRTGNTVTMPKQFVRLAGTRATARSFDDRVGSAAQLLALRRLSRARLRHTVIFIWSVREEIGLEGARAAAHALSLKPARVHAIDTFVSADSPLELRNFGVAPLGRGAVARALDNSSVTPPAQVDSLVSLSKLHRIPFQVGTTNGGNDGSVFAAYGVPNLPIGWPLRYSHSPAETLDLRDVVSLSEMIRIVAERW